MPRPVPGASRKNLPDIKMNSSQNDGEQQVEEPEVEDSEVEETKETEETEAEETPTPRKGRSRKAAEEESSGDLLGFDATRTLMELVSNPDVQAVLEAQKTGRKIKIVAEETAAEADEAEAETELEELEEPVKKALKLIDKKMKLITDPLNSKIATLESLAKTYEQQAVSSQIKNISGKHKDFNKYRKSMAKLVRDGAGAGLSVEELYLVSKHRAGDLKPAEASTHSERPTPTPRRREAVAKRAETPRGRRGWNMVLADALENLTIS